MTTRTLAIAITVLALVLAAPAAPVEVAPTATASAKMCDLEDDPVGGATCTVEHYQRCVERLVTEGACPL